MSDEDEQPRPIAKPLEYWHTAERSISSVQLAFSFVAGLVLSTLGVLFVGGFCTGAAQISAANDKTGIIVVIALWCVALVGSIITTIRFSLTQRELSMEARRQPLRFFQLGAIIGVGLAALLFGLCCALV